MRSDCWLVVWLLFRFNFRLSGVILLFKTSGKRKFWRSFQVYFSVPITASDEQKGVGLLQLWTETISAETHLHLSPARVKNFLFPTLSRLALGPTQPPIKWVPGFLTAGVKRPGSESDNSPPTSAEIKKTWTYTFTPPYAFVAQCLISYA
jgi:hypothetical protein